MMNKMHQYQKKSFKKLKNPTQVTPTFKNV